MFRKLPLEFDAAWYAATYPDVALSGMRPADHYLRFGKMMGRKPSGPPKVLKSPKAVSSADTSAGSNSGSQGSPHQDRSSGGPEPIIGRPMGFDAAAAIPLKVPAADVSTNWLANSLEALATGAIASREERDQLRSPIQACARMMAVELPSELVDPTAAVRCASALFQTDETRIENAWYASESMLRFRIAGGVDAPSYALGWTLRAYQFDGDAPTNLKAVGLATEFPGFGPIFHDIELHHPLMPLLLELSDAEDVIRGLAFLPFPSLLPGGMHGAELNALQTEANPMDAFWSLSDLLLQEFLGQPEWGDRSIAALSVMAGESGLNGPALRAEVQQWLASLFELVPSPDAAAPGFHRKGVTGGLELVLAQDCVPTVSALVSRQFDLDGAASLAGPLLVADFPSLRPRWSVSLPYKAEFGTRMPILRSAAPVSNGEGASRSVATHLAIALRSANLSDDASASEGEQRASAAQEGPTINPMSIVADVGDADRAERLLQAIREAVGETDVELIVRLNGTDLALSEAVDRIWGSGNWKAASPDSDLRDLASAATHDHLLTVSDRVISIDSGALRSLGEILDDGAATASVSCTLFAETIIKKKAVAQPASAGLFPVGVSFVSAPNLAFGEPDVRQALPAMTYPVVANTLHFTMWRRAVLARLPRQRGPVPNSAEDIRIGLDLLEAGHQNLCTSRLAVRLSGAYKRRDAIDPLGSTYLDPGRWEDVLGRVTLVRELF